MSIIPSLARDGVSDDCLPRQGYGKVIRISGKNVIRICGTRKWELIVAEGEGFVPEAAEAAERLKPARSAR
jgi:hypothetical protein